MDGTNSLPADMVESSSANNFKANFQLINLSLQEILFGKKKINYF
jgi:hypothetical protein